MGLGLGQQMFLHLAQGQLLQGCLMLELGPGL